MNSDTLNEISQLKADNALLAQALADCHIEIERLHKLNLKADQLGAINANECDNFYVGNGTCVCWKCGKETPLNLKQAPTQGYCHRCGLPKTANCDCWNPNNET